MIEMKLPAWGRWQFDSGHPSPLMSGQVSARRTAWLGSFNGPGSGPGPERMPRRPSELCGNGAWVAGRGPASVVSILRSGYPSRWGRFAPGLAHFKLAAPARDAAEAASGKTMTVG